MPQDQVERQRRRKDVERELAQLGLMGAQADGEILTWWEICERLLAARRWRPPTEHPEPGTPVLVALDVGDNTGAGLDECWAIAWWNGEIWVDVNGDDDQPRDLAPWMHGWQLLPAPNPCADDAHSWHPVLGHRTASFCQVCGVVQDPAG